MGRVGTRLKKVAEAWPAWWFAGLLPMPVLLAMPPEDNFQVACVYLGIANGWLAAELFLFGGLPESFGEWLAHVIAVWFTVGCNAALFVVLGLAVGVKSNLPFPLIAALSCAPAVGLVPWLIVRVRDPWMTVILGCMIVASIKLAACVVCRFVYGPDYIEQGYVAGDWRTAKLMLTLFWIGVPVLSLGLLACDAVRIRKKGDVAADERG